MNSSFPQVNTTLGLLAGSFEAGLAVFKGIPYAAPPSGKLRWQPPQPCPAWADIRPAQQYGPSPPQNTSNAARFKEFVVEGPQDEDCLFLNIWTPGLDAARRPVMVWIHGGVFTMGSGSQSVFDGSVLAANQNVVVVTINYRLGWLGFLNLREISGGQIPSTGNEGLLDQIAALQWLKANIEAFGGDPGNITLFGESAGGTSIECLLAMPAARGLFHKAIMQSNIHQFIPLGEAVESSLLALQELGISPHHSTALWEIPVARILAAQKKLRSSSAGRRVNIAPVIDGRQLPAHPLQAILNGNTAGIAVIIGTNREETRLFQALHPGQVMDEPRLLKEVRKLVPSRDPRPVIASYRITLAERGENPDPTSLLVAIQTDLNFRLPAMELLKARCHHSSSTFAYQFDWASPALCGLLGACHGMEIGFIFGHYDDSFGGSGPPADRLSRQMQQAWASFARQGSPSGTELGDWLPYCPDGRIKIIGQFRP